MKNLLYNNNNSYDKDPNSVTKGKRKNKKKARRLDDDDDTPKSFKHFMKHVEVIEQKRQGTYVPKDGEDGGEKGSNKTGKKKQQKREDQQKQELTIRPGESMAEFSRRVNDALPLARPKSEKQILKETGIDLQALTKKKGDKKKKQKKEATEKADDAVNEEDDDEELQLDNNGRPLNQHSSVLSGSTKKSRRDKSPDDPWLEFEQKKRKQPKFGDVVDRPPDLKLPTKLLNNVPKAAGSMAKRHMLSQERERFIEKYREYVEKKRLGGSLETLENLFK